MNRTTDKPEPETSRPLVAFALGGLAGNNAHGAGFLQGALDAGVRPDLISCTSGQVRWVKHFLDSLPPAPGKPPGSVLRREMEEVIAATEPFRYRDANFWHLVLDSLASQALGRTDCIRIAWPEWPFDFGRNILKGASRLLAQWPDGFVAGEACAAFPARVYVSDYGDAFFRQVSDAFNASPIAIMFNSYDPGQGIEIVHLNPKAQELLQVAPGDKKRHRDRTLFKDITPAYVRDALWLYEYGFEGKFTALDGCYYRMIMLNELQPAEIIFVARPLNNKWVYELPSGYTERQDMQTEINFNGSYAGEREKILMINKILEDNEDFEDLAKRYHRIDLVEIELDGAVQRGFFDYIFEDMTVFKTARAEAKRRFNAEVFGIRDAHPRIAELWRSIAPAPA